MLRAGPILTLIVLVRGSAAESGPTPTLIAGDARGSDSVQHADIQLDVTNGRGRALQAPATCGTLIGRKAGQTMQIFAYSSDTSTNVIDVETALRWLTVEVAFANGEIESVAAEYGLTATIAANKKFVGVGDLTGSGDTYPAGLAMTVTFTPGTDMSSVFIDFSSSTTAILHKDFSAHPTVSWTSTPRVATVVQDKSNNLYLFASPNTPTDGRASTIEIALTDTFAESNITSLLNGMTPQVGSGFFGLGFLDGVSKLPDGEAIAVTSRPLLDIDVDSVTTAVVASPVFPQFEALIFVIVAAFFDPCGTCNGIVKKTGDAPKSYPNPCLSGDPTKTYKDNPNTLPQETTECYTDIADESPARRCVFDEAGTYDPNTDRAATCLAEARGGGSAGTWVGVTIGLVLALALAGLLLRARKPRGGTRGLLRHQAAPPDYSSPMQMPLRMPPLVSGGQSVGQEPEARLVESPMRLGVQVSSPLVEMLPRLPTAVLDRRRV